MVMGTGFQFHGIGGSPLPRGSGIMHFWFNFLTYFPLSVTLCNILITSHSITAVTVRTVLFIYVTVKPTDRDATLL